MMDDEVKKVQADIPTLTFGDQTTAAKKEKEEVQTGYIIKVGPGYPLPGDGAAEEWKPGDDEPRYLPLQVKPGDMAIFLLKNAVEIKYDGEKYFIVPQSGILMVEREEF